MNAGTRPWKFRITSAVLFAWIVGLAADHAIAETRIWRKVPLRVDLVVGVEQMLILPQDAAVGLPPALSNSNVFRTLATGGALYWTALEPFASERIQVRLASGEFLLFDVSASVVKEPPARVSSIQVVIAGDEVASEGENTGETAGAANLFELIRYAAQSIYSPERLIAPVPDIKPVQIGLKGNFSRLYDEGRQSGLVIQPYKAWSAGAFHVTAFIVTNEHRYPVTLDHRKIMHTPYARRSGVDPHFVASAFYRRVLSGRDRQTSRTTLFIVTDRPIRSVIRGA